jgi:ribosomal protein S1
VSETGVARDADIRKAFPIGADVEVVILEIDPAGRRIRLSNRAVVQAREVEEVREYTERKDAAPAEGFGSLADKLRGALEPREK